MNLLPFKELIKQRCGLSFEGVAEKPLSVGLHNRMAATGIVNVGNYLGKLISDDVEFHELVCLLTINETYFYREAEQLHLLVDQLLPRMLAAKKDNAPLSILSAGCSTGEEPYSIAIALREKYGESAQELFSLSGGDIDKSALDKARTGRYTEFSFRGLAPALRERYFEQHGKRGWTIKQEIRQQVDFHQLNLLADHYPPGLHNFDVIFFRNVSIYFDEQTRNAIQRHLSSLLKDHGVLIVGIAETLANDLGVLHLEEQGNLFYFTKQVSSMAKKHGKHSVPAGVQPPPKITAQSMPFTVPKPAHIPAEKMPVKVAVLGESDIELALRKMQEKNYDAAMKALAAALKRYPDDVPARLLQAQILLHRKDYPAVDELARRVLQTETWSVDAAVLLGLSCKWRKLNEEAIKWFKQAVYSNNECWPAHYYLAELYRAEQRMEQAVRSYRVALQLLSAQTDSTDGLTVIKLGLPTSEVRFLCEHQLAKLGSANKVATS